MKTKTFAILAASLGVVATVAVAIMTGIVISNASDDEPGMTTVTVTAVGPGEAYICATYFEEPRTLTDGNPLSTILDPRHAAWCVSVSPNGGYCVYDPEDDWTHFYPSGNTGYYVKSVVVNGVKYNPDEWPMDYAYRNYLSLPNGTGYINFVRYSIDNFSIQMEVDWNGGNIDIVFVIGKDGINCECPQDCTNCDRECQDCPCGTPDPSCQCPCIGCE